MQFFTYFIILYILLAFLGAVVDINVTTLDFDILKIRDLKWSIFFSKQKHY